MSAKEVSQVIALFRTRYRMLRDSFNAISKNTASVASGVAFKRFATYHSQIVTAFENILRFHTADQDAVSADDFEEIEQQFSEVNGLYGKIEELMTANSPPASAHSSESDQVRVQLPSIKLPYFSGEPLQWLSFRDLFQSLVDKRPNLSDSEKHYYLRTSLGDEPKSIISHLPMDGNNYQVAWKLLSDRYNNSRALIDAYLGRIMTLPNVTSGTPLRKEFYDPLRECTQALAKLNLPVSEWSYLLVFVILQKLPNRLRQMFEERYGNQEGLPTFDQLLELLDEQGRLQLSVPPGANTSGRASPGARKSPPRAVSVHAPARRRVAATAALRHASGPSCTNQVMCSYCNTSHSLYRCREFLKLHPHQRSVWAARESLCQVCLRGHSGTQCAHRSWCKHCSSQAHNTLLCYLDANKYQTREQKHDDQSSGNPAGASPIARTASPPPGHIPTRPQGARARQANAQFEQLRYGRRSPSHNFSHQPSSSQQ